MPIRARSLWSRAASLLATGFGIGFCPIMPGTIGSLFGPPLVWWVQQQHWPVWDFGLLTLLFLIGVTICGEAAKQLKRADPPAVVFDEIVAFFVVFSGVRVNLLTGVIGFAWFRLFDIAKPWPIRRVERLPGGWGIMADDMLAGVYAGTALWLTDSLLPAG